MLNTAWNSKGAFTRLRDYSCMKSAIRQTLLGQGWAGERNLLPDSPGFSMVFVDGLHTAQGVGIDFALACERLVPGGGMVFNDYFEETIPDYTGMIDALMLKHGLTLINDEDSRLVYFEKTAG